MQMKESGLKESILVQAIKDMNAFSAAVVGNYLHCIL